MRLWGFFFFCVFVSPVFGDSFLTAQSFPKTFEDLSFKTRMDIMASGYAIYQAEYDDNGNCIKHCAYPGLNVVQEHAISVQDTNKALEKSKQYEQSVAKRSTDTQRIVNGVTGNQYSYCSNRNTEIPTGQKIPWSEPVSGKPRISSPYGPRRLEGKNGYHNGIDYAVPNGTSVYSPADGTVVAVFNDNTCGKGIKLKHEDGTQTTYCHLSKQMVYSGTKVGAGCKIAESGNTGHSTGPHLHYGMTDSDDNKINPAEYTKRGF